MRISVAMATYNGERFLAHQLESIARQSRPPDELVVSDDASADRTIQIVRDFAKRAPFDVVTLANDDRVGYADNFLRAMKACTGDLISFSDQDDVWHPDKLALSARPLELDSEVSLVIHSARAVDQYLRPVWSHPANHIRRRRRLSPGSLPPFAFPRCGFAMMFRSAAVADADIEGRPHYRYPPVIRMVHDTWVQFVCGALGAIVLLPDELVLFRRHPGTTTDSWSGHLSASPTSRSWPSLRLAQDARRLVHQAVELRTENEHYRGRAEAARERQAYLEQLRPRAHVLGPAATAGLDKTIESHLRFAQALDRRALTYADRRAAIRAVRVIRHVLLGDYRPKSRGGLGAASFLRDVAIGLRPPSTVSAQ